MGERPGGGTPHRYRQAMSETIATAAATLGPPLLILPSTLVLLAIGAATSTAGTWHRAVRGTAPTQDSDPRPPCPTPGRGDTVLR